MIRPGSIVARPACAGRAFFVHQGLPGNGPAGVRSDGRVAVDSFLLGDKSSTSGIFVTETVSLILRAHHQSRVRPCRSVICFLPHSRRLRCSAPHPQASLPR
ncbi:hypothetical protein F01_70069 [Burkholderia cenocepacia]|nr:hypothetical protein F01_70069 [Burkholderia cenocepacia]